jgi:hypothetical protein
MVTTAGDFERDLNSAFAAALAEVSDDGRARRAVGVALYFQSYSSWTGKALYLEDIFVEPAFRGTDRRRGRRRRLQIYCAPR